MSPWLHRHVSGAEVAMVADTLPGARAAGRGRRVRADHGSDVRAVGIAQHDATYADLGGPWTVDRGPWTAESRARVSGPGFAAGLKTEPRLGLPVVETPAVAGPMESTPAIQPTDAPPTNRTWSSPGSRPEPPPVTPRRSSISSPS